LLLAATIGFRGHFTGRLSSTRICSARDALNHFRQGENSSAGPRQEARTSAYEPNARRQEDCRPSGWVADNRLTYTSAKVCWQRKLGLRKSDGNLNPAQRPSVAAMTMNNSSICEITIEFFKNRTKKNWTLVS
jgi:hypothetical protein